MTLIYDFSVSLHCIAGIIIIMFCLYGSYTLDDTLSKILYLHVESMYIVPYCKVISTLQGITLY